MSESNTISVFTGHFSERKDDSVTIICCLGGKSGDYVIVKFYDIDYVMPYAYLPSCFTDLESYCNLIIDNIYIVVGALKTMMFNELWRHPFLDDIFGIPKKAKR